MTVIQALQIFSDSNAESAGPGGAEYIFYGPASGTVEVPASCSTITFAGCGAGGGAVNSNTSGQAGGGAASNVRGYPIPASSYNGLTLEYSVGGDTASGSNGAPTYVNVSPGGTNLVTFYGGNTPGPGGPATGAGPLGVAGGNGAAPPGRFNAGLAAGSVTGGCGGGGGGGAYTDNMLAGTPGGAGGPSDMSPIAPQIITSIQSGPAPTTWEIKATPTSGGAGGPAPPPGSGAGGAGGSVPYATAGGAGFSSPGAGAGGAGGAGAGIVINDPSDPTNNGKAFGGGHGGHGWLVPSYTGNGGRGFLIIQFE